MAGKGAAMQSDVTTAISCDALLDSGGGAKSLAAKPPRIKKPSNLPMDRTANIATEEEARIEKEVREENGTAYQRLREKCRWEQMGQLAVIREWGDPRKWKI